MWLAARGVLLMAFALASLGTLMMALGVMGETTRIDGNLRVTEDLTLADGTWLVYGAITVEDVTLTLNNATLVLNQVYPGEPDLWVTGTYGRIVANGSAIYGFGYAMQLVLDNGGRFTDCRFEKAGGSTGYMEANGPLTMSRCYVNGNGFTVRARHDVTVRGCQFANATWEAIACECEHLSYGQTWNVTIEDTSFTHGNTWSLAISITDDSNAGTAARVIVRNCSASGAGAGLFVTGLDRSGALSVEGNHFNLTKDCAWLLGDGGRISLDGNFFRTSDSSECVMITLRGNSECWLTNETYAGGGRSLRIYGSWHDVSANNMSVAGKVVGISLARVTLEVRASVFGGGEWDIAFEDHATIDIVDCEYGRRVSFSDRFKMARVIERRTVRGDILEWQNGERLDVGLVVVLNETEQPLGVLDIGAPAPFDVIIWNATWNTSQRSRTAHMALNDSGTIFLSEPFDIWNSTVDLVRFKDDVLPTLKVQVPVADSILTGHLINASGTWTERGSGLRHIVASIDGGEWACVTVSENGIWSIAFPGLTDGWHTMRFDIGDRAGNSASVAVEKIITDSVPPLIEVTTPGRYVNMATVRLSGWTEPGSRLSVDGMAVDVGLDGYFFTGLGLKEGPNQVAISAVDRAGNRNSTELLVELDQRPPAIFIDAPMDGSWSADRTVEVSGWTEEDAMVWVDGHPAERNRTAFRASVRGVDGLLTITVQAEDHASNTAEETVLVWIDTCPPDLVVHEPIDGAVTNDPWLMLRGTANDVNSVLVEAGSNQTASVAVGAWSLGVGLAEGWNELEVVATDRAGNRVSQRLRVLLDTKAPIVYATLEVGGAPVEPRNGTFRTREGSAAFLIEVFEPCLATLTDLGQHALSAGLTRLGIVLVEGYNEPGVVVTDMAGNVGEYATFPVVRDSTPPPLRVLSPRPGDVVAVGRVAVNGSTEPGAIVWVGAEPVVADSSGAFCAEVMLTEGANVINVSAEDDFGNSVNVGIPVVMESPSVSGSGDGPLRMVLGGLVIAVAIGASFVLVRLHRTHSSLGGSK